MAQAGSYKPKSRAKPPENTSCPICRVTFVTGGHYRTTCGDRKCYRRRKSVLQAKKYKERYRVLRLAGVASKDANILMSVSNARYQEFVQQLKVAREQKLQILQQNVRCGLTPQSVLQREVPHQEK